MTVRFLIADDHALFRGGLRALVDKDDDFEIIGETGDGIGLLEHARKDGFDIAIIDISMPGPPVDEIIRQLLDTNPQGQIVILTMHEEEYYLRQVFQAGARAFVLKKSTSGELMNAIHAVRANQLYVDPALSHILVSPLVRGRDQESTRSRASVLTQREDEILKLLAFGHTNKEIADQLFISKRTVDSHRAHIMEKLGLNTRAQIVRYAIERGMLDARIHDSEED